MGSCGSRCFGRFDILHSSLKKMNANNADPRVNAAAKAIAANGYVSPFLASVVILLDIPVPFKLLFAFGPIYAACREPVFRFSRFHAFFYLFFFCQSTGNPYKIELNVFFYTEQSY